MALILFIEPEIPQNTGNIVRTCAATNTVLHLIRPLGFSVSDKYLKRAGLDYWNLVNIIYYDNIKDFFNKNEGSKFYYSTTKAVNAYTDVTYNGNEFILFGKETKGLPEELLKENKDYCIRIPMADEMRSLNLANSVIVIYECLRQNNYAGLKEGSLTKYEW